jgi:hypothetical protein
MASTPTLVMLKARDTGNAPPILPWPAATLAHVERLQVISVFYSSLMNFYICFLSIVIQG